MGILSYVLDGDNIRCGLNNDLGLMPKDRKENIRWRAEVRPPTPDLRTLALTELPT
jgi:adenylylsulfate kinase-like enzyme